MVESILSKVLTRAISRPEDLKEKIFLEFEGTDDLIQEYLEESKLLATKQKAPKPYRKGKGEKV